MSDEETGGIKIGDLEKLITDTITKVVGENKPETEEPKSGSSVADMVRNQIEFLKSRDKKEAADADVQKAIADLREATKEKPPVERGRLHKIMGWGE